MCGVCVMLMLRRHRRRGLDAAAFADDGSPVLATIVIRVQLAGRRGILLVHLVFVPTVVALS